MAAGNFDSELIERVVQEVIRRLTQHGVHVSAEPAAGGAELRLTDHVVSLATLEGRLIGVARVVVSPRAVVTPAVKDELKTQQIELARS